MKFSLTHQEPVPLTRLKVLIVEDHAFYRLGLRTILEQIPYIRKISEAANGEEALKEMAKVKYDLVFLDIEMPLMNGVETLKRIRLTNQYTRIIALSMHSSEKYVHDMNELQVNAYLLKDTDKAEVVRAIENVMDGEPYFTPVIFDMLFRVLYKKDRSEQEVRDHKLVKLSPREIKILEMICNQYSSVEIAERLFVTLNTVKTHRISLFDKTGSKNLAGLVIYAIKHGYYKL